jgi:hypothetical protein
MKPILLPLLVAAGAATAVISTKPPEPTGKWVKYKINNYFWAEGACVADVNADGKADILSGPYWYAGPDFKTRHTVYPDGVTFNAGEQGAIPGFEGELSGKNRVAGSASPACSEIPAQSEV